MDPRPIRPGLFHWAAAHPKIGIEVSSYWLADSKVLLDPLLPDRGLDWLRELGPPEHVILTNRHHWRHCSEIVDAFHCPVWCNELGLQELDGEAGREWVRGFRAGDLLPGGIESHEVGVLCPDETALRFDLAAGDTCLAVADGVVRIGEAGRGDGPLGFVPDSLLADEPARVESVKRGLREAYRRLCELRWDTLLLAHGLPLVGDGREKLRAFASGPPPATRKGSP
jgi:hypothetical protein